MNVNDILDKYELRNTGCRKLILQSLLDSDEALTENEIKSSFEDLFDRVTIYRTLKTLEEVGAIHRIILKDNTTKYAITKHQHHAIHSHFHCNKCDAVHCMPHAVEATLHLPKGYTHHELFIVIDGLCYQCNG